MWSWFVPDEYVGSLLEIDPGSLQAKGIEGVLVDLDNTLLPWEVEVMEPGLAAWFERARSEGLRLCIVSNTRRLPRIQAIADRLGIPYVSGARKPRQRAFRRGMEILGTIPAKTAVIGDQVFTDVLGGNRAGAYTILCVPLPGAEFPGTRVVRAIERKLLQVLARRGLVTIPGSPESSAPQPGVSQAGRFAPRAAPSVVQK